MILLNPTLAAIICNIDNCNRYREVHHISSSEHEERLKEHNWTEEDFEAGFQEAVGPEEMSENFLAYQALVKDTLATGEVRTAVCTYVEPPTYRSSFAAWTHVRWF